jgi:hypothetical protein
MAQYGKEIPINLHSAVTLSARVYSRVFQVSAFAVMFVLLAAHEVFAMDANGDGRADLVFAYNAGGLLHVRTALARRGDTFASTIDSNFGDGAGVLDGHVNGEAAPLPSAPAINCGDTPD